MKRFQDAIHIQQGACNIRAIARALANAADEAAHAGQQPKDDPAVRLIVHQLAFLCGAGEIDDDMTLYGRLVDACGAGITVRDEHMTEAEKEAAA